LLRAPRRTYDAKSPNVGRKIGRTNKKNITAHCGAWKA
jgi:hypothetical protein